MKTTNESINMLNDIYQAASMGVQSSELLIGKTNDNQFIEKLQYYRKRYDSIRQEATTLLANHDETPKEAHLSGKIGLWMGIQWNTLINKSPSHMAEMLIQGGARGINSGEKLKNIYPNADKKCFRLQNKFLTLQQDHLDNMKKFLS